MANVKIKVDFYNEEQEGLIKEIYPEDYNLIGKFKNKTIEIPIEDFKTNAFFRHISESDSSKKLLSKTNISRNWNLYEIYFDYDETTGKLLNKYAGKIEANDVPETLGIAGGLSILNHIYGLTQADWTKISRHNYKDADFRHISSTLNRNLNLEVKGSIVEDNTKQTNVLSQKGKILEKKNDKNFIKRYSGSDTCLGIITVADKVNILQSWLVDPDSDEQQFAPDKSKLLKRLYFYYFITIYLSSRTYLSLALANRIKSIELIKDYQSLNKLPLMNSRFEKLYISDGFVKDRASNRSLSMVGKLYTYAEKELYIVGIERDILDLLIEQDFDRILKIKTTPETSTQSISGYLQIRNPGIKELLLKNNIKFSDDEYQKHLYLQTEFNIVRNTAGLNVSRILLE